MWVGALPILCRHCFAEHLALDGCGCSSRVAVYRSSKAMADGPRLDRLYDKEGMATMLASPSFLNHLPRPTEPNFLEIPKDKAQVNRYEVELAGADLLW